MSSSGAREARFAVSQYSPCRVENNRSCAEGSPPGSPFPGPPSRSACIAKVAAPVRMSSAAGPLLGRARGSNSCRTAPKEKFCSSGAPRAARTVRPRPRASAVTARNSDVFPMPAGPSMTTRPPLALSASATQRSRSTELPLTFQEGADLEIARRARRRRARPSPHDCGSTRARRRGEFLSGRAAKAQGIRPRCARLPAARTLGALEASPVAQPTVATQPDPTEENRDDRTHRSGLRVRALQR